MKTKVFMIGALCVAALTTTAASPGDSIFEAKSEFMIDVRPPEGCMVNYSETRTFQVGVPRR